MAKIKGYCHNYDGCDMAADKVVQEKEKTEFVCEECGKPLYQVDEKRKATHGQKKIVIICTSIVAVIALTMLLMPGGGVLYNCKGVDTDTIDTAGVDTNTIDTAGVDTNTIDTAGVDTDTIAVPGGTGKTGPVVDRPTGGKDKPEPSGETQKNSIDLGYGVYTGDIKNGKAHGHGRILYKKSHRITKDYVANKGDELDGDFRDGEISGNVCYLRQGGNVIPIKP